MIYKLESDHVSIRVSTLGAQLQSLYNKDLELEYLWQAAEEIACPYSMLLFPVCGRTADNRIIARGKQYPLGMHAFAKDMEFTCISQAADELVLELTANEKTLRMYPYFFRLRVRFCLEGHTVREQFAVFNEGDDKMYFSLGFHPGFFFPLTLNEVPEDYQLRFDREQHIYQFGLDPATRLLKHETTPFLDGDTFKYYHTYFNDGPKLLGGADCDSVTFESVKSGRFVEMGMKGFPFMCLWGAPERPSVAVVEPWCGTTDFTDADHVWEKRYGNEELECGGCFEREVSFRLG